MGNILSEEEENAMLEEAYRNQQLMNQTDNMSLDNPNVDKKINSGTAAPNCQPKHTRQELERQMKEDEELAAALAMSEESGGQEVAYGQRNNNNNPENLSDGDKTKPIKKVHSRQNSVATDDGDERHKKPNLANKEDVKKLSYIQMAKLGYQELVNAIIRPPRAEYKEEALGPPAFTFCSKRFTRVDFTLLTKRGLALQCSHWEPVDRASDRIPVVIYMHGNSSARVEVLPQLSYLLSLGVAVFSFDFAGSGKSDGEYVSLGYYEREDLMCVIAHLRATNVVSTIALWGRSMGAATALMHGDRDPSIACMILDSPFADLTQLCEEMVEKGKEQGINVPGFVVSVALRMLSSSIKKQANFNIKHISPIAHADKCFIPALFVAGEHDDFINKHHSEAIHTKYAGDKNLIIVEGDHNSPRPKFMFDSVSIFLQTCLQIPNSWSLPVHPGMNLMAPPWYYPGTQPINKSIKSPPRRSASGTGNGRRKTPQNTQQQQSANGNKEQNPSSLSQQQQASTAAAAAVAGGTDANGYNHEEMGMTNERQREIQASLFKMLGQADDIPPPPPPSKSSPTNNRSNNNINNNNVNNNPDTNGTAPAPAPANKSASRPLHSPPSKELDLIDLNDEPKEDEDLLGLGN